MDSVTHAEFSAGGAFGWLAVRKFTNPIRGPLPKCVEVQ